MAVFGAIFYLGGRDHPADSNKNTDAGSAESDSTSEEVRAAVTQMTDLQKKIESLQDTTCMRKPLRTRNCKN